MNTPKDTTTKMRLTKDSVSLYYELYRVAKITRRDAKAIVSFIIEYIKKELIQGNRIVFQGLGSFHVEKIQFRKKYLTIRFIPSVNLEKQIRKYDDGKRFDSSPTKNRRTTHKSS